MGECSELEFQCLGSQDVGLGNFDELTELMEETIREKKMIASWIVDLRRRQHPKRDREGPPTI